MQQQPPAPKHKHGVLFVHGLGEQTQSDTLLSFGRSLVAWLAEWHTGHGNPQDFQVEYVKLGFAPFDAGSPVFQPSARIQVRPSGDPAETWLLTEAWWAGSNVRPDFWDIFGSFLGYIRRACAELAHTAAQRLTRWLSPRPKDASTDPGLPARLVDMVTTALAIPVYVAVGLLMIPLTPLVLLSRVPIPGLQDFILIRLLKPIVQIQIGEFYTYFQDELQAANMRRRIAESIAWLLNTDDGGGSCEDVTIVAHSGGAIVTFGALTDLSLREAGGPLEANTMANVRKLITLGSGLNHAWLLYKEKLHGPLPANMHWIDFWTAFDSVPAKAITPPKVPNSKTYVEIFQPSPTVIREQGLYPRHDPDPRRSKSEPHPGRLIDENTVGWLKVGTDKTYAIEQLPATLPVGLGPYWPVSEEVTNRMAVLIDHGKYWANDEQFNTRLVAEIDQAFYQRSHFWRAGVTPQNEIMRREGRTQAVKDAVTARRVRVTTLAALRLFWLLVGIVLIFVFWRFLQPDGAIGAFIVKYLLETPLAVATKPVAGVFDWLHGLVNDYPLLASLPGLAWLIDALRALPAVALGAVVINIPVLLAHAGVSNSWDHSDEAQRKAAIRQIAKAADVPGHRVTDVPPQAAGRP